MRAIPDALLLGYMALRISNGSVTRRICESVLFTLLFLGSRLRRSASRGDR